MKRIVCLVFGHKPVPVSDTGMRRADGMILPSIDGSAVYKVDPDGKSRACLRCRKVWP